MTGRLSSFITGAAAKRLTAVEARPDRSNQHEFNGAQALRELFGDNRETRFARFVYLSDDQPSVTSADGSVTWYDARERHPTRSEYRLYFTRTDVSEQLRERDLALILRRPDDTVLIAFASEGTTAERQLQWLFGFAPPEHGFDVKDLFRDDVEIGFAAREVLAQLEIEPSSGLPEVDAYLDVLLERFGGGFPSTREFSEFARAVTLDVDPVEDPDEALVAWLEREEALFRELERHIVLQRLREGFADDVDAFIQFSLSVQNRRKSRVGHALEHHLQAILEAHGVSFSRGAVTERTSRPDFLFPSIEAYRDASFPAGRLTMLAAKSTCKDRWRQILAEADRIPTKHLLTLEPGLSFAQTSEMRARRVQLVLPRALHPTLSAQQLDVLTLGDFLRVLTDLHK